MICARSGVVSNTNTYLWKTLPKQGKLSPACRVVAQTLQHLVESWGHQLAEPP